MTSRRVVLMGLGALPFCGEAPMPTITTAAAQMNTVLLAQGPDPALSDLARQWHQLEDELSDCLSREDEEGEFRVHDRQGAVVAGLTADAARSPEGLEAKAAILRKAFAIELRQDTYGALLGSLFDDIRRLAATAEMERASEAQAGLMAAGLSEAARALRGPL
jgi:hypothetical protein